MSYIVSETVSSSSQSAISIDTPSQNSTVEQVRNLSFSGSAQTLFGMWIVNVLLTFLTLGIYYFWAKVKVRTYILSQTSFDGHRFAYHGTGYELLVGWFKGALLFGLPWVVLNYGLWFVDLSDNIQIAASILSWFIILAFPPFIQVWSLRYRLSRTSWCGIRFSFRGRLSDYFKIWAKGITLTILTAGLYYPFFATQTRAFMVTNSRLGNRPFTFDGKASQLFKVFFQSFQLVLFFGGLGAFFWWMRDSPIILMLIGLVLIGPPLMWLFIIAEQRRFFWNHTCFTQCRFQSTVNSDNLLILKLSNLGLLLLSFGLAWPWVRIRSHRFALEHLILDGPLCVEDIRQERLDSSATGEEISDLSGIEFDWGL